METLKRSAFLYIAAVCLLLSACGNQSSVGVIGGADGPTNIIVGDKEIKNNSQGKPVRMANVDGELYFETDKDSAIEARCGVVDGNFENIVDTFELPKKNGEINFDGADGYQIGMTEDIIEIPIEKEWKVFKKLDTNRDASKYRYCYVLEGRLPNAQGDSHFLVLADTLDITFEEASYQLFGSNMEQMKDIYVLPIEH